jgi:hypothetical protein
MVLGVEDRELTVAALQGSLPQLRPAGRFAAGLAQAVERLH